MPSLTRTATASLALALVSVVASCGDDDGGSAASADCTIELLEGASLNTDSFPSIYVEPRVTDDRWAGLGEVECAGISRAADITYLVGELDVTTELPADTAFDDRYAVVEPGGDPTSRLEDPDTTWSEHPGVTDLVQRLAADGAVTFQLAAPAPDRGPVNLMSSAVDGDGRGWLVVQFVDEAAVADGVEAIVAELSPDLVDGEPKIEGAEATIELSMPAGASLLSIDLDLALARRR